MFRSSTKIPLGVSNLRRCCTFLSAGLPDLKSVFGSLAATDIQEFRKRAFGPETPILITTGDSVVSTETLPASLPAAQKWFTTDATSLSCRIIPSIEYFEPFAGTRLPYELTGPPDIPLEELLQSHFLVRDHTSTAVFHHFHAPLSLFLRSSTTGPCISSLYIAQAQLIDLPTPLQRDLPVPSIVKEAGKGDVYDCNLWMGISPTYTPLHRDPNPNLFVQIAGRKRMRLFTPGVGVDIYREVQRIIGKCAGAGSFRGVEMMEGRERLLLHEAVWGECGVRQGLEVEVGAGESLFIPKGWWHSIKSIGDGVTASVNWWFR